MKEWLCRLKLIGIACVLAAGLGVGVTVATATPAFAAAGSCQDWAIAQPTPVHYYPWDSSPTVEFLNSGAHVTGICYFLDNITENRWYMQVYYSGPGNDAGYGFIWVQRLSLGSEHICVIGNGATYYIGSSECPLDPTATGS